MTWNPEGQPLDVDEDAPDPDVELERQDEDAVQAAWRSFEAWTRHDPWYVRAPLVAWFGLLVAWRAVWRLL